VPVSKSLKAAQGRYQKKCRVYTLKVNVDTEKEIYDKLNSVDNVNGYIKNLVQKDILK
jgi:hypothetical protein